MPSYDYRCSQCDCLIEIFHAMSDVSEKKCPECKCVMIKQIGTGYLASKGFKPTYEENKETEHTKKVKDLERAIKSRKKAFGHDSVGDPVDKPDPKHVVRAKVLAGAEHDVDKSAFIKAAAKDPYTVDLSKRAISSQGNKPATP